jgi:hypothetical protein
VLNGADLNGADLSGAIVVRTHFGDIDLRPVKGLEKVYHNGPSYISTSTLSRSQGYIPEAFLRGAGLDDTFIEFVRSLIGRPVDYYTCFISYSSGDQAFAERLYADLQSNGVRCWFAPEDLKWGEKIRKGIDEAIRFYDKLLLVLSTHSVASQWVEQEVATALAKERIENRTVLFPIRLDNTIMEVKSDWPFLIRNTRNIGDFCRWKNPDDYQKSFKRLLRDLKAETEKTEER